MINIKIIMSVVGVGLSLVGYSVHADQSSLRNETTLAKKMSQSDVSRPNKLASQLMKQTSFNPLHTKAVTEKNNKVIIQTDNNEQFVVQVDNESNIKEINKQNAKR